MSSLKINEEYIPEFTKMLDLLYGVQMSSENKKLLSEQVAAEMIEQNLNPINIDDIRIFWKLKGIELHG